MICRNAPTAGVLIDWQQLNRCGEVTAIIIPLVTSVVYRTRAPLPRLPSPLYFTDPCFRFHSFMSVTVSDKLAQHRNVLERKYVLCITSTDLIGTKAK